MVLSGMKNKIVALPIGQFLKVTCFSTLLFFGLPGCAKKDQTNIGADIGYADHATFAAANSQVNKIRQDALHETATTLGAQGALAWRGRQINEALEAEAGYLNRIFSFNQLLLKDNVLPPILVESLNNLNLSDNNTIRSNNKTYQIIAAARFVTAPPTWRTYLWTNFKKPALPSHTLLPTTRAETVVWNTALRQGWKQGLEQANAIFSANVQRLKRDMMGMILYRRLLASKMISSPHVAKADLGIIGNAHELHIGEAITRITSHSALQLNSDQWKPVITPKD